LVKLFGKQLVHNSIWKCN